MGSGSGSISRTLAIDHFARAMRLSPLDFGFHAAETGTAFAHIRAGRYEEAFPLGRKGLAWSTEIS